MPMFNRKYASAGKRRNYKKKYVSKTSKVISRPTTVRAVRAIAKSVIKREAEDKFVSAVINQNFNSTITTSGECYPVMPQVPKGTEDFQRIGERIRGKYLYVKGYVQIGYDAAGNLINIPPSTLRVMILSQKNLKTSADVTARADVQHLLKDNVVPTTTTARPYLGTTFDNLAPINKDLFTVHMDKKIKFNWQNIQALTSGQPTVEWQTGNNLTRYFTCRIKVPNTLTFDDGNGDQPNNCAPFLCMGSVCDDGQSAFTLSTPWHLAAQSTLYYEDV